MQKITVETFFENMKTELGLFLVTKKEFGLKNEIKSAVLNRPGLALTGYYEHFLWDNIQILSKTEIKYINSIVKNNKLSQIKGLFKFRIPCFITVGKSKLKEEFVEVCNKNHIPIFSATKDINFLYHHIMDFLDAWFSPTTQIHGTLVDVYGTGVLLMGRSGIGKSEIALDLIERGHRLVTDDVVTVVKKTNNVLIGKNQDSFNEFMEIRGIGLINIKEIFGTRSIRMQKRIEIIIMLEDWKSDNDVERLGLDEETMNIFDVPIPKVKLKVFPGKNITVITETIALNLHLKVYGYNAAKVMNKMLIKKMQQKTKNRNSLNNYLSKDYE